MQLCQCATYNFLAILVNTSAIVLCSLGEPLKGLPTSMSNLASLYKCTCIKKSSLSPKLAIFFFLPHRSLAVEQRWGPNTATRLTIWMPLVNCEEEGNLELKIIELCIAQNQEYYVLWQNRMAQKKFEVAKLDNPKFQTYNTCIYIS